MENKNKLEITQDDLIFLENLLKKERIPLTLNELTLKLAFHKTAEDRTKPIKVYNPYSDYEVGDLIYKYYDEPLKTSSRGTEHFKGGVVLEVVRKIPFPKLSCQMLEVDYRGGGLFRKYTDYMKKTKTQILLPCNLDGRSDPVEFLPKEKDPRQEELPLKENELKLLESRLKSALSKSDKFYSWNGYWYLTEAKGEIEEQKISEVEQFLKENKNSVTTQELIKKYFSKPQISPEILYLELNHILESKYRKKFVLVSPDNWGKWNLKENLEALKSKIPLSAPRAEMPEGEISKREIQEKRKELGLEREKSFPCKLYLTWREILSGGIRIPHELQRYFNNYREYLFKNKEDGKEHLVYYYPEHGFLLGFKEVFENHAVIQGSTLTIEHEKDNRFNFVIKKSKKKIMYYRKAYNWDNDRIFTVREEKTSFCAVNRMIYLGEEIFENLSRLYDERKDLNLQGLLHLVFQTFGADRENFGIHYLRLYHIVDLLKNTDLEQVEAILLTFPEFYPSEKEEGIFHLDLKKIIPEEKPEEKKEEVVVEEKVEKEVRVVEKVPELERKEEIYKVIESMPIPSREEAEKEERVEREKPKPEKKKIKKVKKARPGREISAKEAKIAKKLIEEKIEWEESRKELVSIYQEESQAQSSEKHEEEKPKVTQYREKAKFGLFAQKLQQALQKETEKK
ncbi:hypothetical protein NLB65_02280, partial [Candidatus Aminicenantes bacterium AC-335-B20]|nr:hypothetical protein [Candidatus Aminicenantes bacterium AC-335-B20]